MSKLKIKPIGDRILVQHVAGAEQTHGSIIIPDSAKEKPKEAKVIALGRGTTAKDGSPVAFEVKVGDTVMLGDFAGVAVTLYEQKYTLIREDDILGVIV